MDVTFFYMVTPNDERGKVYGHEADRFQNSHSQCVV